MLATRLYDPMQRSQRNLSKYMISISLIFCMNSCIFAVMRLVTRKIFILFILLYTAYNVSAQDSWPSPEVAQMYRHAQDYVAMGNYADAIVTYKQVIILAPGKFILYEGLGKAQYLSGSYKEAEETLQPYIGDHEADEAFYDMLGASRAAQNDGKGAKAVLKKGLEHFPASGLLYYDMGHLYELEKKKEEAITAWVEGISNAPAYAQNYYAAARAYMNGDDVLQGLLYGEIYLDITQDTTGVDSLKEMLFAGYKTMFDDIASRSTTALGETSPVINSFADAVEQTYVSLTPVVSDGITTENLTMVRTRFIMEWMDKYAGKYPYSLFTYQDYLIRNGLFDIYNEWLFGKAESTTEYNAWNQFHPGEMDIWLEKKREHPLKPLSSDVYDSRDIGGKRKK